jgi:hypothetical protein
MKKKNSPWPNKKDLSKECRHESSLQNPSAQFVGFLGKARNDHFNRCPANIS